MNIFGVQHITSFIIYRIIGGIGVGLASMLSPMYIAEIAPPKIRGQLVSYNQFAIIFGMLVIYFVNYVKLKPGEAMFLGPNVIHAYILGILTKSQVHHMNITLMESLFKVNINFTEKLIWMLLIKQLIVT